MSEPAEQIQPQEPGPEPGEQQQSVAPVPYRVFKPTDAVPRLPRKFCAVLSIT